MSVARGRLLSGPLWRNGRWGVASRAVTASASAAPEGPQVEVRLLAGLAELLPVDALFSAVWGEGSEPLGIELLRALSHAGGYVSGAFRGEELVGASVAFVGCHRGPTLHSHQTGVLPAAQGLGVGRALKLHQRDWALARGIEQITWTFDPLVRRNAWFNLARLGARPDEYLVDFYGAMSDGINVGDASDRLYACWSLTQAQPALRAEVVTASDLVVNDVAGRPVSTPSAARFIRIGTPPDIERLRRADPAAAREWRLVVRELLGEAIAAGSVVGFTEAGEYVVDRSPEGQHT